MYIVVFVTLIAILLTNLETRGQIKNGMLYGFVLVTLLGCIHYNYGNDYKGYLRWYDEITRIPLHWEYLFNNQYEHEPGWVLLNYFFSHIGGFFMMVAVLNILQNAIYYHFIKDNLPQRHWTIAVMIYLLNTSLYIMNFSMMRQGLAISLFVYAWTFLKKKKLIFSLLIIAVASNIHSSAQILLPLALLPFVSLSRRIISFIYIGLIFVLYFSYEFLSDVFMSIISIEDLQMSQSVEYYEKTHTNKLDYGYGFFINLIPFVVSMWVLFTKSIEIKDEMILLITLSMLSFLIAPFAQIIQHIGRFGMYFTAYGVIAIPYVYSLLPNKRIYRLLIGIYLFMLLYSYYMFFQSPIYGKRYSTFHSIFEIL